MLSLSSTFQHRLVWTYQNVDPSDNPNTKQDCHCFHLFSKLSSYINLQFHPLYRATTEKHLKMLILTVIRILLVSVLMSQTVKLILLITIGRSNRKKAVGFFHPYTNDGGGGERVLWCAVKAIQEEKPDLDCVIYTGDHDATPDTLLRRAVDRFGVNLISPPKVVFNSIPKFKYC